MMILFGRTTRIKMPYLVVMAFSFLGFILVAAVLGNLVAPYPYSETDLLSMLQPPAFAAGGDQTHLLGTDNLGRDILSRALFSVRITVIIAFVGTTISAVFGSLLGMAAGELRGRIEEIIMMLVDIQTSLPFLIFALTALAILGNSFGVLLIVIGINGWESFARLARGLVLRVMEEEYVLAARSIGVSRFNLYRRTLLPNIAGPLIVQYSITLSGTILLESALGFLGLGFQPPLTSLGQMLGEGREFLLFAPWLSVVPGTIIFLMILSINVVGDWLRDLLDPLSA